MLFHRASFLHILIIPPLELGGAVIAITAPGEIPRFGGFFGYVEREDDIGLRVALLR